MALQYDFDMAEASPDGQRKALWRDPAVASALQKADPAVRHYFQTSGFGTGTLDSGAPAGQFPAADEAARATVINNLTQNIHNVDQPDLDWGGFNLREFLAYLGSATPAEPAIERPKVKVRDSGPEFRLEPEDLRQLRRPSQRKGFAIIGLGAGLLLLALAALMFVS